MIFKSMCYIINTDIKTLITTNSLFWNSSLIKYCLQLRLFSRDTPSKTVVKEGMSYHPLHFHQGKSKIILWKVLCERECLPATIVIARNKVSRLQPLYSKNMQYVTRVHNKWVNTNTMSLRSFGNHVKKSLPALSLDGDRLEVGMSHYRICQAWGCNLNPVFMATIHDK